MNCKAQNLSRPHHPRHHPQARWPADLAGGLRRRSAIEPVIGHLKSEHRMGRNYLWHRRGDATNAILVAVGYNFRRLIRWLKLLLYQILARFTLELQLATA